MVVETVKTKFVICQREDACARDIDTVWQRAFSSHL